MFVTALNTPLNLIEDLLLTCSYNLNISFQRMALWIKVLRSELEHCCFKIHWMLGRAKGLKLATSFLVTFGSKIFNGVIDTFQPSVTFHIDTSHLISNANQMTDFYIKCNTGLKWFNIGWPQGTKLALGSNKTCEKKNSLSRLKKKGFFTQTSLIEMFQICYLLQKSNYLEHPYLFLYLPSATMALTSSLALIATTFEFI